MVYEGQGKVPKYGVNFRMPARIDVPNVVINSVFSIDVPATTSVITVLGAVSFGVANDVMVEFIWCVCSVVL